MWGSKRTDGKPAAWRVVEIGVAEIDPDCGNLSCPDWKAGASQRSGSCSDRHVGRFWASQQPVGSGGEEAQAGLLFFMTTEIWGSQGKEDFCQKAFPPLGNPLDSALYSLAVSSTTTNLKELVGERGLTGPLSTEPSWPGGKEGRPGVGWVR